MRKVIWLLGAISAVGLAMTAGLAQERAASSDESKPTTTPRTGGLSFLTRPQTTQTRTATRSLYREPEAAEAPAQLQRYQRTRPVQPATPTGGVGLKNYHQALFGALPGQPVQSGNIDD